MSRKDYVRLANTLAWSYNIAVSMGQQKGVALAIRGVINALKEDNARFDEKAFVKYIEAQCVYKHEVSQIILNRDMIASEAR